MNSCSSRDSRLHVMLDAVTLADPPTGVAVYATELAAALAQRTDVEVTVAFPIPGPPGTNHFPPSHSHRQLWRQFELPKELSRDLYDVYHGLEYGSLLRSPVPRVATVHDLFFRNLRKMYGHRGRWHMRAMVQTALHAERVIVPSSHVGEQLVREFGYPRERIRVIYEAPQASLMPADEGAIEDVRREFGVQEPYLLCVGIGHRGKRAVDVLRALALVKERGILIPAIMVGWPDPAVGSALKAKARELGIQQSVHFTSYFHGDLAALYSGALAFVCASVEEGFGIPPLEAMACGVPVISTDAPAMNETLAGAAMFVPVRSPEAVARVIEQLHASQDMRADYRAKGLDHARGFSWEKTAEQTMNVYREIA